MKSVRIALPDRPYSIHIGPGLIHRAGEILSTKSHISQKTALIVSQREVARHYEQALADSLQKHGFAPKLFLVPAAKSSEAAKTEAVFSKLVRCMAETDGKNKSLFVVALGGGVIGDLAGFAASIYRRGVPLVQVPTTLTAQVDSAIGGKNAIDLPEGKNLLGSIYQPAVVLSDTDTLKTLSDRILSDGFAEVIKYGVIEDINLFSLLEKNGKARVVSNPKIFSEVIERCAKIKARVVERDELDKKDIRIVLNFGHTAGHAIEAASAFSRQYTHGEAVAIGMLVACDIAAQLGVLKDPQLPQRLEALLVKFGLPVYYKNIDIAAIFEAMGYDKKAIGGKNRFVLPVRLGKTEIVKNISTEVISRALLLRKR